jgi:clathrin heavy chain
VVEGKPWLSALYLLVRANFPNKVVAYFAETGQTDKIVLYSKKVSYTPDFAGLLKHIMRTNPEKGAEFATQLANDENGALIDIERVSFHSSHDRVDSKAS